MKRIKVKAVSFLFLSLIFFAQPNFCKELRTLKAIDLIGDLDHPKEAILKDYPFKIGTQIDIQDSHPLIDNWCEHKSKELDALGDYYIDCSRFLSGDLEEVFAVVAIQKPSVEIEQASVVRSCNHFIFLKNSLLHAHRELHKLLDTLPARDIKRGIATTQFVSKEKTLHSEGDAALQAFNLKLSKAIPTERFHLYKVLEHSCNDKDRAAAAELLNWAKHPKESIQEVYSYLEDHHMGVRNNITRFIAVFAEELKDEPLLREHILRVACKQLRSVVFYDKNKALAIIFRFVQAFPDVKLSFRKEYPDTVEYLEYLASHSETPSLGGLAKYILEDI